MKSRHRLAFATRELRHMLAEILLAHNDEIPGSHIESLVFDALAKVAEIAAIQDDLFELQDAELETAGQR